MSALVELVRGHPAFEATSLPDAEILCGVPLNQGQDEPSCQLPTGHGTYHDDGGGNRWSRP